MIHPGYGFVSEFARKVEEKMVLFIGLHIKLLILWVIKLVLEL